MNKVTIKLEGFGGELNVGKIDKGKAKKLHEKAYGDYDTIVKDEETMSSLQLPTYSQINDLLSLYAITTNGCKVSVFHDGKSIFEGDFQDLETQYGGDYNQENIIAVSENPDEHDFATVIIEEPVFYSFSSEDGIFFNADVELPDNEQFDLGQLALVINEVKINTDDETMFGYDFIIEVRYKDAVINSKSTDTSPYSFSSYLIEP